MFLISIGLSGCGKSKVEDVAIKYIEVVSEGDIPYAKQMVMPQNQELKRAIATCKREESSKLMKTASSAVKNSFYRNGKFKDEHKKSYNKRILELEKKYGSLLNIPREEQQKAVNDVIKEIANGDEELANMIKLVRKGDSYGMAILAVDILYENTDKVKEYCVITEIQDIKVIHVEKSKEGDQAEVKLEVSYKNGKSHKYDLALEEVQGVWKISGGLFRPW